MLETLRRRTVAAASRLHATEPWVSLEALKGITGTKGPQRITAVTLSDGTLSIVPAVVRELVAKDLERQHSSPLQNLGPLTRRLVDALPRLVGKGPGDTMRGTPFTPEEMDAAIAHLNRGAVAGIDGVTAEMYRALCPVS
jgi:hypothetical protein